jgi:hypothetical protein
MLHTTTLVLKIVWDGSEVDRPGAWDWATLIDADRGHVEIVADSDDRRQKGE